MSEIRGLYIDDDKHWRDTAFRLEQLTRGIQELSTFMSNAMDDLKAASAEQGAQLATAMDLMTSAVSLLNGLVAMAADPADITALTEATKQQIADLGAKMSELGATIVADTPPPAPAP